MDDTDALPRHRGTRAIQRMVEFAPATGGLALWVQHRDRADDPNAATGAPPVATDGHTLYYHAAFERLPLPEQIGLIAHEVLHIALRHPQRFVDLRQVLGDVDLRLYTLCADAIVNSTLGHLGWLELPAGAVMLEHLLADALGVTINVEAALMAWDVERLYRAIDDRLPTDESTGARRDGSEARRTEAREDGPRSARVRALGREAHADLLPASGSDDAPESQAEHARTWNERLLRAHAGDGAFSMLRTLIADLPAARTPWEQVLRTWMARGLSTRPAPSWSRPSRSYIANQGRAGPHRRMPWEPGLSGARRVPRLALIVDVSGSIDDALLARFAREIETITRRQEAGLVLVVGDDRVRRVEHFAPGESDLQHLVVEGGGGTDFTPLLEEADRHRPDIGIVLTDLEGPARFRPRWPVIWAVPPTSATPTAPFGRTLSLQP